MGQELVIGGGVPGSPGGGPGAFVVVWRCASPYVVLPLWGLSVLWLVVAVFLCLFSLARVGPVDPPLHILSLL